MTDPVRILILDRNRYRSLLVNRAVSEIAPLSVVARFDSGAEVVRELLSTRHEVAILSLEGIERPADLVQAARLARPDIALVVVGLRETPKRVVIAIRSLADSYLCWDDDPAAPLPEPILRAIAAAGGVASVAAGPDAAVEEPILVG